MARTMGSLRPLDPNVCLALGFEDLAIVAGGKGTQDDVSQGISQGVQLKSCGGPVVTLLLKLLQKTLADSLAERKSVSFKDRIQGNATVDDDSSDNPYALQVTREATSFADIALASCEESSRKSFELLDGFLEGGVFASIHEHLAVATVLRTDDRATEDDDDEEEKIVSTARDIFNCINVLMSSELLTRSNTGLRFLGSILDQIAKGNREYDSSNARRASAVTMLESMGLIMDSVVALLTGSYTGDMDFALDSVSCLNAICDCSRRVSEYDENGSADSSSNFAKLSEVAHKLLKQVRTFWGSFVSNTTFKTSHCYCIISSLIGLARQRQAEQVKCRQAPLSLFWALARQDRCPSLRHRRGPIRNACSREGQVRRCLRDL